MDRFQNVRSGRSPSDDSLLGDLTGVELLMVTDGTLHELGERYGYANY
jgi:hypothetical protein